MDRRSFIKKAGVAGAGGAAAAVLASSLAYASSASAVTIAYSGYPGAISAFWASVTDAVKAEAAKQGVELLDLTTPEADAAAQKNAIDTAISQGVDGLIIGAIDNRGFDDTLTLAQEKGIPVVAVDTGIDHPWVKSLVQTDNLAAAGVAEAGGPRRAARSPARPSP